ncbi:MAG: hypothetical protein KAS32_02755 [Candidatus Peribacteraceae bacterium]|nr:hypothetical protein [Candidatus Peribacteraceae bacterium]
MSTEKLVSAFGKFVKGLKFKLETDGITKANVKLEIKETDSTPGGKLSVDWKDGDEPDINLEVGEFQQKEDTKVDGMPPEYDGLKPLNEQK